MLGSECLEYLRSANEELIKVNKLAGFDPKELVDFLAVLRVNKDKLVKLEGDISDRLKVHMIEKGILEQSGETFACKLCNEIQVRLLSEKVKQFLGKRLHQFTTEVPVTKLRFGPKG